MKPDLVRTKVLSEVEDYANRFGEHWENRDDEYWFYRLIEEVGELGASLAHDHDDTPEHEMRQIASICVNWLTLRIKRGQS